MDKFLSFPRVLIRRFWTRVADSISYVDNRCANGTKQVSATYLLLLGAVTGIAK